jgi:phosphohistidine phosphatase SixA
MFLRVLAVLLLLSLPARAEPLALDHPGAVALMRHSMAPGTGDPANFTLGDCATQRNLSEAGRVEARAVGARLRAAGVRFTHILASEWCRASETAELLGMGAVTPFPPLNSFFSDRSAADRQTADTLAFLSGLAEGSRVILVTHQVNITALTGIVPRQGEIVVAVPDGRGSMSVLARIAP